MGATATGRGTRAAYLTQPQSYCCNYEYGYWENVNTSRILDSNMGQIFTHGGTEQVVGVYRQETHRTEVYLVAGGTKPIGRDSSQNTTVDWALRITQNLKVDVKAAKDYRYHQVYCINNYDGGKRYPNVGEWYPLRATGGTSATASNAAPFSCITSYISYHAGTQILNVSKSRTRGNSSGINLSGVVGGISIGYNSTDSTTTTSETRFTVYGKRASTSRYGLCGSNDIAIAAESVREIVL